MFDFIYKRLFFVNKRFYFVLFKIFVVFMFFLIVLEIFIDNKLLIIGINFSYIMELIIILIGLYVILLFLKGNEDNFFSNENKEEIEKLYELYNEISGFEYEGI